MEVTPKFDLVVPCGHKLIFKETGKLNLILTIIFFVMAIVFVIPTIFAIKNKNIISAAFFLSFAIIALVLGVLFLIQTLKKPINNMFRFQFFEDWGRICKENLANKTSKELCDFLYSEQNGKKYLHHTIETALSFELCLYWGEINGYPQFKKYVVPKDIFKTNDDALAFKIFLDSKAEFIIK